MTSLGQYAWGENENSIYSHLYIGGSADFQTVGGVNGGVKITTETNYPWGNSIAYKINPATDGVNFNLILRIPAWSSEFQIRVNNQEATYNLSDGYATINRPWQKGDEVTLTLDMKPRRVYANSKVRANAGAVCVTRGPIVYCIEGVDNGDNLAAIQLPRQAELIETSDNASPLGNIVTLSAKARRVKPSKKLYSFAPPTYDETTIKLIPYYAWGNRETSGEPNSMRVWINE